MVREGDSVRLIASQPRVHEQLWFRPVLRLGEKRRSIPGFCERLGSHQNEREADEWNREGTGTSRAKAIPGLAVARAP